MQKTAYELRISDWSSAVCSSDLLERVAPSGGKGRNMVALTAAGRRQYLRGDKYAAARARSQAQREKRVAQFADLLADGYTITAAARVSIGRGPCREKWCPTV